MYCLENTRIATALESLRRTGGNWTQQDIFYMQTFCDLEFLTRLSGNCTIDVSHVIQAESSGCKSLQLYLAKGLSYFVLSASQKSYGERSTLYL